MGQQAARDRARQARDAEQGAHRIARQIDRVESERLHHGADLAHHPDLEREDAVEVHEAVRQDVEDRTARVGDDVERELAPFQRALILDDFDRQSGAPNAAASQLYAFEPTGASARPPSFAASVAVAVAIDRRGQRRRNDVVGAEGRGQRSSLPTPFCGETNTHLSG